MTRGYCLVKPKPQQLHLSAADAVWSCKALLEFLYVHGFGWCS